jgi:hypothetical protein
MSKNKQRLKPRYLKSVRETGNDGSNYLVGEKLNIIPNCLNYRLIKESFSICFTTSFAARAARR